MYNGWEPHSPALGPESYPTPAPTPRMANTGILCPPSPPRLRPLSLPPTTFSDPRLHPLLVYSTCPGIEYDVRQPPAYASAPNARLEWAYESATHPGSTQIIITCMELPCPFEVYPSAKGNGFITIHDILQAVHVAFRKAARSVEGREGSNLWTTRPGLGSQSILLSSHLRRLVALPERYVWAGLSEQIGSDNWLLHIE
ncbi:hypothetical protein AX15_002381 [Amanita polypyramis BW_CC]|nr:hypothetical protein AX15_002381 [Amanita polypyramis BW_CC]